MLPEGVVLPALERIDRVEILRAHDLARARGKSCLRSCELGTRAQPTRRKLELISVGQTAVLRAEGGAGG